MLIQQVTLKIDKDYTKSIMAKSESKTEFIRIANRVLFMAYDTEKLRSYNKAILVYNYINSVKAAKNKQK